MIYSKHKGFVDRIIIVICMYVLQESPREIVFKGTIVHKLVFYIFSQKCQIFRHNFRQAVVLDTKTNVLPAENLYWQTYLNGESTILFFCRNIKK